MTNKEMVDLLREYTRAKTLAKELRIKMLVAVVELGVSQKEAYNIDVTAFLDGYLVGQGIQQSWRDADNE
jgi:hypothetical protein